MGVKKMGSGRSKAPDIFKGIFDALSENHPKNITDIKKITGFHHDTIRNYLEIIEFIQSQPKLFLKRTGHSYQAVINNEPLVWPELKNNQMRVNIFSQIQSQIQKVFKIILVGDDNSGKNELVEKYLVYIIGKILNYINGIEFFIQDLEIKEIGAFRLQIWDILSLEKTGVLLSNYMKGANGIIFLFNITDMSTLASIDDWLSILRSNDPKIPILVAGTNHEKKKKRSFPMEEYIGIVKDRRCSGYIEISAKTGENVKEMFETITKMVWENDIKYK